ncbi:putative rRNA and tRNA processing protein [Diplogelasinospora grovesii]|uniref:Ribonuclease P protein subunit n=1 Tax=Diplogelasinospora grovesii TaxID=303347 RepID=A0AAN6RZI6_9PEZI|nr:putative rRNA and tRNA processing protein [Diplogelasinospora grovesii]
MDKKQKQKEQGIAQVLLARAHSPDEANRIYTEKIQQRPLFLAPSSPPPADARERRRRERQKKKDLRKKALKPKPLSAKQRRKLGVYEVPKQGQKYATFEPLHNLWVGYIREILGNEIYTGGEGSAAKLSSADFHGAEVEVVRSGCVSRVGIKGIVIKDSKFAFEIITRKNQLKLVPKEGTIFRVELPAPTPEKAADQDQDQEMKDVATEVKDVEEEPPKMVFEIHGDQFMYRSSDRATKKFKAHFLRKL